MIALQHILDAINVGGLYALMALGIGLIFGVMRLINFAHGEMVMAGGYAMASGHVGVANVHISCGLGNAMGMLYNAHCEGTPLVLTAGHQDQRLRMGEPVLEGDIVRVARPWTKWSAEVHRAQDIPTAVRRAIQTALTPPN